MGETGEKEPLRKDPRDEVQRNWQGAVLLRDEIKYYCEQNPPLIHPFDKKYLQPASYRLRLGGECRVDGKDSDISLDKPRLTIPPHGIAVVSTLEDVNIPGFLIARWNLKVKKVYYGLVWVGSLQVDPGYNGKLFCPLYNLSTEAVNLEFGEPLFTIDFVRTTLYDESKGCEMWKSERPTKSFKSLDVLPLKSAPKEQFDIFRGELEDNKTRTEGFQSRIDTFQGITFTVLGIIVAALAFMGASQLGGLNTANPSIWQFASWIIMFLAILILIIVLALACIKTMLMDDKNGHSSKSEEEIKNLYKIIIPLIIIILLQVVTLGKIFGYIK